MPSDTTKDLRLEKQTNGTMCWAAVSSAVLSYHGIDNPGQVGLEKLHGSDQNSPTKILKGHGFKSTRLVNFPKAGSAEEAGERLTDVHENIKQRIASGPMLASLKAADDAPWRKADGSEYNWHHAILVKSYDGNNSANATITYVDPGKEPGDNERQIGLKQFVEGFDYTSMGDNAQKQFPNGPKLVRARLSTLTYLDPP